MMIVYILGLFVWAVMAFYLLGLWLFELRVAIKTRLLMRRHKAHPNTLYYWKKVATAECRAKVPKNTVYMSHEELEEFFPHNPFYDPNSFILTDRY